LPAGVEARPVLLASANEPARAEWFVAGTAQQAMAAAPPTARRPRIVSPLSGTVYALDPDIPMKSQRIRLKAAGAVSGERLTLDGRDAGVAADGPAVLPGPGRHALALVDGDGRVLDRSVFAVR
jgi:penicillin-binding protein 1C